MALALLSAASRRWCHGIRCAVLSAEIHKWLWRFEPQMLSSAKPLKQLTQSFVYTRESSAIAEMAIAAVVTLTLHCGWHWLLNRKSVVLVDRFIMFALHFHLQCRHEFSRNFLQAYAHLKYRSLFACESLLERKVHGNASHGKSLATACMDYIDALCHHIWLRPTTLGGYPLRKKCNSDMIFSQSQGSFRKLGESKAEALACVGVFQQAKLTIVKSFGKQTKTVIQASSHMSL
eukprot:2326762-Pleurochrysis_carterae.AAC.2